ncbi:RNA polymerase sigma-70 factor [Flavivirga amylovorans]|uniref:RNA polymerase sigma-70 factor n=1 Tax=Flavivirga amylovorans TaxID=870486 RepID=A0ABT8WX45_9FLAO|nr:RNA polymerase sigma-70 factor [Flavivirga amylovorans]MDO5986261.1 RNA polymerase sigma-70 factor [Flavivirga amylovorans]
MKKSDLISGCDKSLVESLKEGEVRAFETLFNRYNKKMYGFALGYLKSTTEAEGLVQDVFSKVWEKRNSLKPEYNFKSYIFTIAFNLIKKTFIKRSRMRNYIDSKDKRVDFDQSTLSQIDYNFMMERIMELVDEMPLRRRETFVKSRFEGLSVKEIAKEMSVSPKTVENQITSALKFIKANWRFNETSNNVNTTCF